MEAYPVIVMPSCPEVALPVNVDVEDQAGAARMLEALRFQLVLPVLGLPGLAVPTAPVNGLPMGVQIVSRRYREDLCLEAGEIVEAHAGTCTPIDPQGRYAPHPANADVQLLPASVPSSHRRGLNSASSVPPSSG